MMLTDDELAYIWSVAGEVEGFLEDFPRATGARAVEIVVKDIPKLRAHIERLTAERDELLAATEATYDALDGLYGAARGESIPYFSLTQDRKDALDKARVAVHSAMHKQREPAELESL